MPDSNTQQAAAAARRGWRQVAKSIPFLYWAGGWVRYIQFRHALAAHQRAYDAEPRHRYPPPMLRYRVHRALDEASYAQMGQLLAQCAWAAFRDASVPLEDRDVLDFGCGPGRVIREFHALAPAARLTGSDIDADAIAWARANLGGIAIFGVNSASPPAPFPDAAFDAVYSISLFTHLDETMQDMWLHELARLLQPGGVLVTTVHGHAAAAGCSERERDALDRHGIAFRVEHTGPTKLDGLPDFYQTTFHTRAYVERHWAQFLDVISIREGGAGGLQDLVTLRKR